MPIIPVRVSTCYGNKIVYALIDSGSQELLVSKKLFNDLRMTGPDLQVCLVTADGEKKLVNSKNVDLQIGPIDPTCKSRFFELTNFFSPSAVTKQTCRSGPVPC